MARWELVLTLFVFRLNVRNARDGVGHDAEIVDARLRERLDRELGGVRLCWQTVLLCS